MAKCPEHNLPLVYKKTRYGPRGQCPTEACTVVHWGNDPTATPADYITRQARNNAHGIFDNLWRSKRHKRGPLYKRLAHHLDLPIKDTHIGRFDIEQCRKTIEFAKLIKAEGNNENPI